MVLHGGIAQGGTACEGTVEGSTVGDSVAQSGGLRGTVDRAAQVGSIIDKHVAQHAA